MTRGDDMIKKAEKKKPEYKLSKPRQKTVKAYSYGLLDPAINGDLAIEQLRLANRFYNRLMETEHKRRDLVRENMVDAESIKRVTYEAQKHIYNKHNDGLYWSTRLLCMESIKQAAAVPLYDKGAPNNPRFSRWEGAGKLASQIQKGIGADMLSSDTRVQVDPIREDAWDLPRGERKRATRTTMRLRVGTGEKRCPIWVEWPMILHRPFPANSTIKTVSVTRKRVGPRYRWDAQFTIETPNQLRFTNGCVGIDAGWRSVNGGLRVAVWSGGGEGGEVIVGDEILSGIAKADELRSTRDENMNAAIDFITAFRQNAPNWFKEATQHAAKWRSPKRVVRLLAEWRANRCEGDEDIFGAVKNFVEHDRHLWEWETNQRRKSHLRRREMYRIFAHDLAERFSVVVLEDLDFRQFAESKALRPKYRSIRNHRKVAAHSELVSALKNAFLSRGGCVLCVNPAYTSKTCSVCGEICRELKDQKRHVCEHCGVEWDRDFNAAENIRSKGERYIDEKFPGSARSELSPENIDVNGGAWATRKRKKAEKEALSISARNDADNVVER